MKKALLGVRMAAFALAMLLGACSGPDPSAGRPTPEVGVVVVEPRPLELRTELPGRLEASRVAQVRARATGIVLERVFQEGSEVKEGEVLFRIDPDPLQAALDAARAQLARAEADLAQAKLRAERYAPLVATRAISQQDYDDAVAARDRAAAEVAVAQAALKAARLNLEYATVRAPISGRIGRAKVTEGALVSQAEATELATIQQIDPLYLDMSQASTELAELRRAIAAGRLQGVQQGEGIVTIFLDDGTAYPHPGTLLFTDITVDETTGALTLRAVVPNPDGELLPGMYVRAELQQGTVPDAILIPQQAVLRDASGATVLVVGQESTIEVRKVEVGQAEGEYYVIRSGLKAGDRVVVDGIQKVRPDDPVTPVPWSPAPASGPPGSNPARNSLGAP